MSEVALQSVHKPVTDAFLRLSDASQLASFQLNEGQVAAFHRDGFVAPITVLDKTQVLEMQKRLEHLRHNVAALEGQLYEIEPSWRERPNEMVLHFLGAWMVDEWFHDLIFHPALTVPMAQVLKVDRLRFWHDQIFFKPARHPGAVPWHQDYSYWTRTGPACHVTANLVLDDTSIDNGCLHVIPGSHRWPLQPSVPFDAPTDTLCHSLPTELANDFSPVAVPLRAGEASLHHSHIVHGSGPNPSPTPRRATVVNAMGPEVRVVDGSRPLLKGVPLLPEGAIIEGEHFPVLLDLNANR